MFLQTYDVVKEDLIPLLTDTLAQCQSQLPSQKRKDKEEGRSRAEMRRRKLFLDSKDQQVT